MYIPTYSAVTDLARLHDAIEQYSFGMLVSAEAGGALVASHLPFLLDRSRGLQGTLIAHMARANPQWRNIGEQKVLVVFSGPHAYISPTWYEAERVVPTWNYVAIHAYGPLELIEDIDEAIAILEQTVNHFERPLPRPWRPSDQPKEFISQLTRQIVAFRIPIERLEGKWKLNQNHPPERREKVVAALESVGGDESLSIAALMRQELASR